MKYYIDAAGNYLGGWDGTPPVDAIEVPTPPNDARQLWSGDRWGGIPLGVSDYRAAIQQHMDAAAIAAGYDDIASAVTYAEEPSVSKFQVEGQAFRTWRSLCWAYSYDQLARVEAGQRPQPTIEQFLAELPSLDLPQQ